MIYHDPHTVLSPRDFVSNVRVLHDGGVGSFSVALIEFEGVDCLAMRWNVARREEDDPVKISGQKICVGMPSSRGYPVWFVLPFKNDIDKFIETLKENAEKITA